mmetsp:Transcript_15627/g.22435  ORF Transcript_15627/g.22435 Transcript_15627/m.22435 type:complete len:82 (+) Transcript_15627:2702-2947(+)
MNTCGHMFGYAVVCCTMPYLVVNTIYSKISNISMACWQTRLGTNGRCKDQTILEHASDRRDKDAMDYLMKEHFSCNKSPEI